jgi:hypothetical protein
MVLTVRARQAERCALCHDALEEEHFTCSGCGTRIHRSCRRELGRGCPSLGCRGTSRTPRARFAYEYRVAVARPVARSTRSQAFWRGYVHGLGVFAVGAVALVVACIIPSLLHCL